ncbi:hypothetical protein Pla108_29860 [Botrimarina colliarenosi]|uniref:Zinc-finger domain-containing protein n=1 Tax=Botrimarina colliarenosi TaxID=2528001 RepID=A0A5C6A8M8_9BACT|nr:hypothetical protein [Botrimarina colliarenosi]TWT95909.1 hypothetical protein Pla108_29860 [Botrimarina colliarenosi]
MSTTEKTNLELDADEPIDRLDQLLSLFLDDSLSEEEASELNAKLIADPAARTRSFEFAQLHADLYAYFREPKRSSIAPPLPLPIPGLGLPSTH